MAMSIVSGYVEADPDSSMKNIPIEDFDRLRENDRVIFFREVSPTTETWVLIKVKNGRWWMEWGEPAV